MEWIIIVALLAIAVGIGLLARRDWKLAGVTEVKADRQPAGWYGRSRLVLAGCPIGGRAVLGALAGRAR